MLILITIIITILRVWFEIKNNTKITIRMNVPYVSFVTLKLKVRESEVRRRHTPSSLPPCPWKDKGGKRERERYSKRKALPISFSSFPRKEKEEGAKVTIALPFPFLERDKEERGGMPTLSFLFPWKAKGGVPSSYHSPFKERKKG